MSSDAAIGWVLTTASGLRLSQAKTLADLVDAAVHVGRWTLSAIGRCLPGATAAKHRIKRTWRFCDNDRVYVSDVMPRAVERLTRKRKNPPAGGPRLDRRAGVPHPPGRRAAGTSRPPAAGVLHDGQLHRTQSSFEEGLLRRLVTMLPAGVKVILLADRGFGRAALAWTCEGLRLGFLIRIKPDVRVAHPSDTGRLDGYPVWRGMQRVPSGARDRSGSAVSLNAVIRWRRSLPERRDEPWFLLTNLDGNAVRWTDLDARRTAVEEWFRDGKDGRYGLGWGRRGSRRRRGGTG